MGARSQLWFSCLFHEFQAWRATFECLHSDYKSSFLHSTYLVVPFEVRVAFKMSLLFATVITAPSSPPTMSNLDVHLRNWNGFVGLDCVVDFYDRIFLGLGSLASSLTEAMSYLIFCTLTKSHFRLFLSETTFLRVTLPLAPHALSTHFSHIKITCTDNNVRVIQRMHSLNEGNPAIQVPLRHTAPEEMGTTRRL